MAMLEEQLEEQSINSLSERERFLPTGDFPPPRKDWTPIYRPPIRSYRISYRPRKISSKGTILVLFWVVLANSGTGTPQTEHGTLESIIEIGWKGNSLQNINYAVPIVAWLLTVIVSGWIADTKLGNYKTLKLGLTVIFLATVLDCIVALIKASYSVEDWYLAIETIPKCLKFIGNAMFTVTSIQLGLDQMPDASSANITSFIAWFVFAGQAGIFMFSIQGILPACFFDNGQYDIRLILKFLPTLYASIALCSDFLLSPKWIIKEPASSRCFKLMYEVIRFAAKNKSPLNRSALTYWEEDLPSRLDLGKSRYGGPFTTEQVENVKTALKMIVVSIPFPIIVVSFFLSFYNFPYLAKTTTINNSLNLTQCARSSLKYTAISVSWWAMLITFIHEVFFYPLCVKWIPTTLKRAVMASILTLLFNGVYLIISSVQVMHPDTIILEIDILWIKLIDSVILALLTLFLYKSILEFVCAQTPQNLKGFVIGYTWCLYALASITSAVIYSMLVTHCEAIYCPAVLGSIGTVLSMIGVPLLFILAYTYKTRVRDTDETQTPYSWIHRKYSKYLLASS